MADLWLTDASGNGLIDGSNLALILPGTPIPPPPGVITAVMNGFNTNTMNIGTNTTAAAVWLYDPNTGKNVVTVNGVQTEFDNLSQFPGTFGFTS